MKKLDFLFLPEEEKTNTEVISLEENNTENVEENNTETVEDNNIETVEDNNIETVEDNNIETVEENNTETVDEINNDSPKGDLESIFNNVVEDVEKENKVYSYLTQNLTTVDSVQEKVWDAQNGLFNINNINNDITKANAILFNNEKERLEEEYKNSMSKFTQVSQPGETFDDHDRKYEYKYDFSEDKNSFEYFYRNINSDDDWIKQTNPTGELNIQAIFEHTYDEDGNLVTLDEVKNHLVAQEWSNDTFDATSGNKNAKKAEGLILSAPESRNEFNYNYLVQENIEVTKSEKAFYNKFLKNLVTKTSYEIDPNNTIKGDPITHLIHYIYNRKNQLGNVTTDNLGIDMDEFVSYIVENQGSDGIREIIKDYIQVVRSGSSAQMSVEKIALELSDIGLIGGSSDDVETNTKVQAEFENRLKKRLKSFIEDKKGLTYQQKLTNYFKNNWQKYTNLINDANEDFKKSIYYNKESESTGLSWGNWLDPNFNMFSKLQLAVTKDFLNGGQKALGIQDISFQDSFDIISSITSGIDSGNVGNYDSAQFPTSVNLERKKLADELILREKFEEGATKSDLLPGYGDAFISTISDYSGDIWNTLKAFVGFDVEQDILIDTFDPKNSIKNSFRLPGFVSGVTTKIDDTDYLLDKNNKIFTKTPQGEIIPFISKTGDEYKNVYNQLKQEGNTTQRWADDILFNATGIMTRVGLDIGGYLLTRGAFKGVGATKRINTFLKKPEFKIDPKKVKFLQDIPAAAGYWGFSGYVTGYSDTLEVGLQEGLDFDTASILARYAAPKSALVYAATSVWMPTSLYNKIPLGINNFKKQALKGVNAYKKNGLVGYNNFWQTQLNKFSPTSLKNIGRFYDFAKGFAIGASAELPQELTQQQGTKLVNQNLNSIVNENIFNASWTTDELINTGIYSIMAGGVTAGTIDMVTGNGLSSTNAEAHLRNLNFLGKNPKAFKTLLTKMVKDGTVDQSIADKAYNDIIALRNQKSKIPSWIKNENTLEMANILQKKEDLINSKKFIDKEFHDAIDIQIEDLNIDLNLLRAADLDIGNKKIADQLGYEFYEGTTEEIENKIKELKKLDPNANVDNSIGFGAFVTAAGKQYALIDTNKAAKKNYYTTGQHEGVHGLLNALVRRDPTANARLGKALLKEIRKGINKGSIKLVNTEFGNRFSDYVSDPKISDNVVLEELMPLLSEALTRKGLIIEETVGTKIADVFRRFFQSFGINFGFSQGKDVLNMIRDYNLRVESGKGLSKGLQNLAKDKGSFGIGQTSIMLDQDTTLTDVEGNVINRNIDQQVDQRQSKDLEILVSDFKKGDPNVDVEALTNQYQALGRNALQRWTGQRKVPLNLSNPAVNQEVTSLLNKEFNSFVKNFDPNKSTVSTYMNNIAKRIGPILVEEGVRKGKQVSQDVLTEKGVSLEVSVQPDIDQKTKDRSGRAKIFPSSVKVIADNITGETRADQISLLKNDITEAILRVGVNPKKIAKYIVEKTKTKEYRALIKKALGPFGSEQYIDNVNRLFNNNNFIKSIPVANIKRRFGKLFGIKQTGTTPTIKIENGKRTDFKKQVYKIPAITDVKLKKIKQYFLTGEKRSQSLFEIIGEGIAVEAINEISTDQEFMNNLQDRLKFRDSNLTAEQFMAELEFDLDKRNLEDVSLDDVRLSKETEGKFVAPELTPKRISQIGAIVGNSLKNELKKVGLTLYPSDPSKLTEAQKKGRQESIVASIVNFGTAIFSDTVGFLEYRGVLKKDVGKGINDLNTLLDAPLDPDFVNNNPEIKKLTKKVNNQYFLDKKKLPKYGKNFTASDIETIKTAETEQSNYAKLTPSARKAKLKDPKFIALQKQKIKVLEKIVKNINEEVRDSDGNIIPERFEFWASWLNSQSNLSKHPIRALAPIKFMSLSNLTTNNLFGPNYVAEHTLPANNVASAIADMIYNNSVDSDFKIIKDTYIQGQLLKTADNRLSDKNKGEGNFKSVMPRDFWNMDNPNVWVRYLLGDPTINLNEYVVYENGKIITIAESLGLPLAKADQNPDSINAQRNLLKRVLAGDISIETARAELKSSDKVDKKSSKQVIINKNTLFPLINANGDTESSIKAMNDADTTAELARRYSKETKGISVFDFDDTLAFSDSKVLVKMPDGKITKITPAEFAAQAEQLQQDGAEFDFSEFNKVVNGRKGPLADLALKRQKKFGSGDIFVLTARPQLSAESIKLFLDGIGLNIPIENITGLENGSPDAKALWVLSKAAQGYNDFYFADDALANVQAVKNVLDQVDVKSNVQQARSSKEVDLNKEFNVIIEQQSGKEWFKTYSDARAKVQGKAKNRFEFFIPPSAEDFMGLMYKILPKGKDGDRAMVWIKENLADLFNKAEQQVIAAKISVANDFNALRENIDNIPKNLQNKAGYSNFTWSQALRVAIWNMQGMDIPGLSTRDKNSLIKLIDGNADMKVFAEKIAFIQKGKQYPAPNKDWVSGTITSDIINSIQKTFRKEALQEWQQNVDIIFSKDNMNKLEALYGSNYVTALKNILGRMKRGSNRSVSESKQVENVIDWLNNSVGTIMFLNRKSALLQLISSINFINWSDNNILAAAKAFANQPQYWKDVINLLNSDYLVQRRNGMRINVAESEIADASKKGGMKGVIAYLLNKGFIFTRIADSLAIATGGATFYRNRVNSLLKQVNIDTGNVYTKAEAEAKAFDDFYQISEESQQSSRTDRISMQQASSIGRLILNFANTPMQYARIMKKSALDLVNGRGDWKTNLSKIVYYGFIQNLIFNAMQQAIFALAFGSDDEEERTAEDRAGNIANGMVDSILRGLGYGGAAVATVKDVIIKLTQQGAKKNPKYEDAVSEVFNFSPAIDSKVRKLRSAAKTFSWNRKEIKSRGFNLDNPAYLSIAQIVSATTNIPLDRAARIMMNLKQAVDKDTEIWQRVALMFGYSGWELGLPYWGLQTTIDKEKDEDEAVKTKYKNEANKLKTKGYKRIPMTKGKPDGKLNVDFIQVARPTGDLEYWLMPKK